MLLRNLGEMHKKGRFIMSELYNRIESLCKSENVTVTTMCKDSGASRASLSDLKVGRKQMLSAGTLSKIANYFGITTDYFLHTPPFDCWDEIDGNRKGFLSYVPISSEKLSVIWGINSSDPEAASLKCFIRFLSDAVISATPTEEGDWDVSVKPEYAKSDNKDVLDDVDLAFYGEYKELDDVDKETVRDMVRIMRERRAKRQEK